MLILGISSIRVSNWAVMASISFCVDMMLGMTCDPRCHSVYCCLMGVLVPGRPGLITVFSKYNINCYNLAYFITNVNIIMSYIIHTICYLSII